MIEPTDGMVGVDMETKAFELGRGASEFHATRRALAAVLTIVEREYVILPRGAQALCCGDHPDVPTRWGVCPACVALTPDEDRT